MTVTEGDAGTANATLTLTLSRVPNHPVYVNFRTSGGTATDAVVGRDYVAQEGELVFG